ncbi:MAG TPA: pantetheine-phosphate adenylyltransferase [Dehalococcoidia bacterium]|nr:pantetheine-phosphate adenylyltransferase [Dehalococcoidia bacterium]
MTIALYPGSFDPITKGHLDIARRSALIFDKVIIGVYDRPNKQLLFNVSERVEMAKKAVEDIANIEVRFYDILTVQFAKEIGARVIVRGLRMGSDFEKEFEMAILNKKLDPEIEFICFMASLQYQFLSSSLLKEVATFNASSCDDFVPENVAVALHERFAQKQNSWQRK